MRGGGGGGESSSRASFDHNHHNHANSTRYPLLTHNPNVTTQTFVETAAAAGEKRPPLALVLASPPATKLNSSSSRANSISSSVRSSSRPGTLLSLKSPTSPSHNHQTSRGNNHHHQHASGFDNKIEKRKRDQYKLTRTLITVVFFVLLSEISSIATYDKIAEMLVARQFKELNYMDTYYKLQVFVSNLIVLIVHSVNFFLYCAFNKKYLIIFKQKYLFLFNLMGKLTCKQRAGCGGRTGAMLAGAATTPTTTAATAGNVSNVSKIMINAASHARCV